MIDPRNATPEEWEDYLTPDPPLKGADLERDLAEFERAKREAADPVLTFWRELREVTQEAIAGIEKMQRGEQP